MGVVITGMGVVSALGRDLDTFAERLLAGEHGIGPIERWDASDLAVRIAAHVAWPEPLAEGESLGEAFAVRAAGEAYARAELEGRYRPDRIALVLGTMGEVGSTDGRPTGGAATKSIATYAERVAGALGLRGPRITISTACTSSANAIGLGRDLLRRGDADAVIAGGVDELTKALFAGFAALGVLSTSPCAPFSEPYGTTLGEGAGFVVLERGTRGVSLLGYGLSSDAHHETTPDPRGHGVARAMTAALLDADLAPADVEYVNAHATGTASNDVAEWSAIQKVFARPPRVSGSKSQLGHAQGAAGVLETQATILAQKQKLLLPTLRFTEPRTRGPNVPTLSERPARADFRAALCASSAFGGANCSLVVGASPRDVSRPDHPVFFATWASAGAWDGEPAPDLPMRDPSDLRRIAPHVDPRGTDPSARALIGATMRALEERLPRGTARDATGLILGATRVSPTSVARYQRSIDERGHAHVDTHAFARVVLHAPAGSTSIACQVRGPTSTLHTGDSSGLAALAYAAELLGTRAEVERMLAAGLDESVSGPTGAACALLTRAPTAVRLSGWALAGDVATATREALRRARSVGEPSADTPSADTSIFETPPSALRDAPSLASLWLACRAADAVRAGAPTAIARARGESAVAVVFTRWDHETDA